MRKLSRILSVLIVISMMTVLVPAEAADPVAVIVNGEEVLTSVVESYETQYLEYYASLGVDTTDESYAAYIKDVAFSACIQRVLILQDIRAQGCYDFDEETEASLTEMGQAAYAAALEEVGEYLRSSLGVDDDADMSESALLYAEELGVTEQDYIDVYRDQYALLRYYDFLTQDCPVTEEDIQAAYDSRVAESKELYENDVEAFETAVASGEEVWYRPAGYRSILQILLKAEGDTEEEKLASVQSVLDEIYARLDAGESFESLIAEYGQDSSFDDPDFYNTGYSVHRESIVWDDAIVAAAFAEEMSAPGTWSTTPVVSDAGVHILYYLADLTAGPAELTDSVKEALTSTIYYERVEEKYTERLNLLSDEAEVVYPD